VNKNLKSVNNKSYGATLRISPIQLLQNVNSVVNLSFVNNPLAMRKKKETEEVQNKFVNDSMLQGKLK